MELSLTEAIERAKQNIERLKSLAPWPYLTSREEMIAEDEKYINWLQTEKETLAA